MERQAKKKLLKMVTVGVMAALTFALSHIEIPIPSILGITRIHLGNSMCLLAGLLFGGMCGGLSGGIGSFFYDLTNPLYIASSPFTFVSKFAMGYTAGKLSGKKKSGGRFVIVLLSAIVGQLVYIALYLLKTYVSDILLGNVHETALADVASKLPVSLGNAVIAVTISVPLYFALRKALARMNFLSLFDTDEEKKGYFNPVTVTLSVIAAAAVILFSINLSAQSKLEKAAAEKEEQLREQLEEYEERISALEEMLGISYGVE